MTDKKDGGVLTGWQLHNVSDDVERVNQRYDIHIKTDKVYILTGTVKEDPTGRWLPGYHMRSSVVIDIDRETGIVETKNTIYKVEGEEGEHVLPGNMGPAVLGLFY